MAQSATIVRIVVNGSPQKWRGDESISPNFGRAKKMLRQAVDDHAWPSSRVLFTVTPGGFIQERMPEYKGRKSWDSRPCDFRSLVPTAEDAIWEVIDNDILTKLSKRSRFLTVGVDLVPKGQSKVLRGSGTCAELVGVVELKKRLVVQWTGKSYTVSGGKEERHLVQERYLESHLLRVAGNRVLVLGCHDLNMFHGRRVNAKAERWQRWQDMDDLTRRFNPTMVLHHPHQTDTPKTWRPGWGGLKRCLGFNGAYASGIAYFPRWRKARSDLKDVLRATKSGDDVIDICVRGFWGRDPKWERY